MTVRKPLISSSEVVNEKRRWTQDWYTWISDLVTDIVGAEGDITTIQGDITTIQGDITTVQGNITTINGQITTINGQITTINTALTGPSSQIGFSNGSNAPTGSVGEYLHTFVLVGSAVSVPNSTDTQIASLALTAGDWDLWGEIFFVPNSATATNVRGAINTIVDSQPTVPVDGVDVQRLPGISTGGTISVNSMRTRVSISSPTTYLLIGFLAWTGTSATGYGALRARRMR